MARSAANHGSPSGMTLLELLLVMALIVTVAAVAMPNVGRSLDNSRLRSGGEQVRVAWAKARVRAMETGRTYAFRFEPSGDSYSVEPWMSQDDYLESSQLTGSGMMASAGTMNNATLAEPAKQDTLPEGVLFSQVQTTEDMRDLMSAQTTGLPQANAQTSETGVPLSSPIFFYPDGTTSTARLHLTNARNDLMEITMRGLTGVVYVKDLGSAQVGVP